MERLTERFDDGILKGILVKEKYGEHVPKTLFEEVGEGYLGMCVLKAYEDTGLDPEQIRELKERDTAKMCKQSIFDHDSITCVCGSDMDKEVEFMFCPWCGQRLKKWED